MEDLLKRLTDMLGKQLDDPCFDRFVQELGETPEILYDSKSMREFSFKDSGIYVTMDKRQNQIKSVFLHLSTAGVEAGSIAPYKGNLPSGITPEDNRATVKKKLATKPRSQRIQGRTKADPKDYWEYYCFGPLELTFIFDGATKRMDALSIHYTIDTVPPEPPPPDPETFLQDRCSSSVLKTMAFAQSEARRLKHNFIGSEFLLLGLLGESQSISASALGSAGVTLEKARAEVEKIIGRGESRVGNKIPYTYGAKRVLALALEQATKLDREFMDDAHLLLGLIECGEGVGSRVLENLHVDAETLREDVLMRESKSL